VYTLYSSYYCEVERESTDADMVSENELTWSFARRNSTQNTETETEIDR